MSWRLAISVLVAIACTSGDDGRSGSEDTVAVDEQPAVMSDQTAPEDSSRGPEESPSESAGVAGTKPRGASGLAVRIDSLRLGATPAGDTARGTISIDGPSSATIISLRPVPSGPGVRLGGPMKDALMRLAGVEVWVRGTSQEGQLMVSQLSVRSVNGVPAVDGMLASDGDALMLVTADGARHRLVTPPSALRSHVGARVWIAGPLNREPTTFGVIQNRNTGS